MLVLFPCEAVSKTKPSIVLVVSLHPEYYITPLKVLLHGPLITMPTVHSRQASLMPSKLEDGTRP